MRQDIMDAITQAALAVSFGQCGKVDEETRMACTAGEVCSCKVDAVNAVSAFLFAYPKKEMVESDGPPKAITAAELLSMPLDSHALARAVKQTVED